MLSRKAILKLAFDYPQYRDKLLRIAKDAEEDLEAEPKNFKKFEDLARQRIQDAIGRGGLAKAWSATALRIKKMKEPVKAQALMNVLWEMEQEIQKLKKAVEGKTREK